MTSLSPPRRAFAICKLLARSYPEIIKAQIIVTATDFSRCWQVRLERRRDYSCIACPVGLGWMTNNVTRIDNCMRLYEKQQVLRMLYRVENLPLPDLMVLTFRRWSKSTLDNNLLAYLESIRIDIDIDLRSELRNLRSWDRIQDTTNDVVTGALFHLLEWLDVSAFLRDLRTRWRLKNRYDFWYTVLDDTSPWQTTRHCPAGR